MDFSLNMLNFTHLMRGENIFKGWAEEWVYALGVIVKGFSGIISGLFSTADFNAVDNSAVTAAAVSLTSLFLIMEIFSQMTSKWFERIEDALQLWIKLVVAKIIIENSSSIIGGIYDFFRNLGKDSIAAALTEVSENLTKVVGLDDVEGGPFGIGYLVICVVLMIVAIVVIVIMSMLVIEVMGIVFEIGIHQVIGPIALSTLCNSTFRSTGLSFIKSYTAVCLQATVISAIFKIYVQFGKQLQIGGFDEGVFSAIFDFISPILGLVVLAVTVRKSSDITKRMLGA